MMVVRILPPSSHLSPPPFFLFPTIYSSTSFFQTRAHTASLALQHVPPLIVAPRLVLPSLLIVDTSLPPSLPSPSSSFTFTFASQPSSLPSLTTEPSPRLSPSSADLMNQPTSRCQNPPSFPPVRPLPDPPRSFVRPPNAARSIDQHRSSQK
ncbi:hypothetical protein BDY24DRAFT_73009 [Mrakia frigida]|uniref:uncharacterized protein n=1 Tax=Mrakia frigida TaxID=29902 RepID=UPI003FCBF602